MTRPTREASIRSIANELVALATRARRHNVRLDATLHGLPPAIFEALDGGTECVASDQSFWTKHYAGSDDVRLFCSAEYLNLSATRVQRILGADPIVVPERA